MKKNIKLREELKKIIKEVEYCGVKILVRTNTIREFAPLIFDIDKLDNEESICYCFKGFNEYPKIFINVDQNITNGGIYFVIRIDPLFNDSGWTLLSELEEFLIKTLILSETKL